MMKTARRTFAALCAGHFTSDCYSSMIFPLLPLLKMKLELSTAQVFWLAPIYAISNSLLQPLYGVISDRFAKRAFAVSGPAVAGLFMSMIGLAPSYGVLVVLLMASGVGIGSFHPQAAAMVTLAAGSRRRFGMAIFSTMGTLGYSLGPVAIAFLADTCGLGSTWYVAGFGLGVSALLFRTCPPLPDVAAPAPGAGSQSRVLLGGLRSAGKPLFCLYMITVLRSGLQLTTATYLPFLLGERGYGVRAIGAVVTMYLLTGSLGGLTGGMVAERASGRQVTLYSGLLSGPLMIASLMTTGAVSILLLGLAGFMLLATVPVNVAMAQELVPGQTSTVSALMMGAAWGVGALEPPLLNRLVPVYGFEKVLILASVVSLAAALFACLLPKDEPGKAGAGSGELAAVEAEI